MLAKPDKYTQMQKEYQVGQMARMNRLQNVIGLKGVYLAYNHVAFAYKHYEYDLRHYLRLARDHR